MIEVQIRTREMHQRAEWGVAAHWAYKDETSTTQDIDWLNRIIDWQADVNDPAAFMDDTVWFNLGRSEPRMPTSGLGIPAFAPGFTGVPLFVVTLTGLVLALVLPVAVTRRRPSVWMAGATAGFALLAVLLPARTFQVNYLVLVAALVPLGFLSIGSTDTAGVESVPTSVEPSLESGP